MSRDFNFSTSNYLSASGTPISGWPMTMAVWFNTDTASNFQTPMGLTNSANNGQYVVSWISASKYRGGITNTYAGPNDSVGTTVTSGVWHHGANVMTSSTMQAFLDGTAGSLAGHSLGFPSVNRISIGTMVRPSPATPMDGMLAYPCFWNVALSANEIAALAAGAHPLTIRPENIVAFWPLTGESSGGEIDVFGAYPLTEAGTVGTGESPLVSLDWPIAWPLGAAAAPSAVVNQFQMMI